MCWSEVLNRLIVVFIHSTLELKSSLSTSVHGTFGQVAPPEVANNAKRGARTPVVYRELIRARASQAIGFPRGENARFLDACEHAPAVGACF